MTDTPRRTVIFAGGGTGGHLFPGIAIAREISRLSPDTRYLFLCTQKPTDKAILAATEYPFSAQPIRSLAEATSPIGAWRWLRSYMATRRFVARVLREVAPQVLVGTGGYASTQAVMQAHAAGIPTVVLNPDAIPGRANRRLFALATDIACQFESTLPRLPDGARSRAKVTGCPIRYNPSAVPPREEACNRLGLNPALKTLVVTGASQGARTVNQAVTRSLASLNPAGWQVLHLAGTALADEVTASYAQVQTPRVVIPFCQAMDDVWAVADLAISRAGANSCAELAAFGVPSVLFPYPFDKELHQRANAVELERVGAAVVVDDRKDAAANAAQLTPILASLMSDAARLKAMSQAGRAFRPDAAAAIAKLVLRHLA